MPKYSPFFIAAAIIGGTVFLAVLGMRSVLRRMRERQAQLSQVISGQGWKEHPGEPTLFRRYPLVPTVATPHSSSQAFSGVLHGTSFTGFNLYCVSPDRTDGTPALYSTQRVIAVLLNQPLGPDLTVFGVRGKESRFIRMPELFRLGSPVFDKGHTVSCRDPRFASQVLSRIIGKVPHDPQLQYLNLTICDRYLMLFCLGGFDPALLVGEVEMACRMAQLLGPQDAPPR